MASLRVDKKCTGHHTAYSSAGRVLVCFLGHWACSWTSVTWQLAGSC